MPERREFAAPWIEVPKDNQELQERYDLWSQDYERDMQEVYGYILPQRGADLVVKHLPNRSGLILEAGAGTGLVGQFLSASGYSNLVGIDLSAHMLEEARAKNVYRELYRMSLGEPLEFSSHHFDAVVSIGVLTSGHAPPSSLDELIRVTKPGGLIVFSMRRDTYDDWGFKEKQQFLVTTGKWRMLEVTAYFQGLPEGEPETWHRNYVYEVQ